MLTIKRFTTFFATACITLGLMAFTGCDNKEEVLDIETPEGEIEVERDRDTGEVDVEVDGNE